MKKYFKKKKVKEKMTMRDLFNQSKLKFLAIGPLWNFIFFCKEMIKGWFSL